MSTVPVPTVVQALALVARDVGAVTKSRRSKSDGNYAYRGIDDVINALHGPLAEHGVVIVPQVEHWATEPYLGYERGVWSLTQLKVRYVVHGPAGDSVEVVAVGEGIDNGDKGTGKAMSYAYKSAISQLFALPTDDPHADNEARSVHPTGRGLTVVADDDEVRRARLTQDLRALPTWARKEATATLKEMRVTMSAPQPPAVLDTVEALVTSLAARPEPDPIGVLAEQLVASRNADIDDDPGLRARIVAAIAVLDGEAAAEAADYVASEGWDLSGPVDSEGMDRFAVHMAQFCDLEVWPS